jgi:hypothetical protein
LDHELDSYRKTGHARYVIQLAITMQRTNRSYRTLKQPVLCECATVKNRRETHEAKHTKKCTEQNQLRLDGRHWATVPLQRAVLGTDGQLSVSKYRPWFYTTAISDTVQLWETKLQPQYRGLNRHMSSLVLRHQHRIRYICGFHGVT